MARTVITQTGLNFVTSANPNGPLFAIKYWVPVYDWRIDPSLRLGNVGLSAIDDVIAEAETAAYPAGEILWKKTVGGSYKYILSDSIDTQFIISGYGDVGNVGDEYVINSKQQVGPVPINLHSTEVPLSDHWSGTAGEFETTSAGRWDIGGMAESYGQYIWNTVANTSAYFPVIDYTPVTEAGQTTVKGQWRCRLAEDMGSFKFNKLALYAVRYNGSGVVDSSPHWIGEAYLTSGYPIKKSKFGDGYNEVQFDVQLQFTSMTSAFSDVFYGSSADYWSKVPNGLHSSEKVSIGTFQNGNTEPAATLHVGRTITTATDVYDNAPNVRMEYVDNTKTEGYTWDFTVQSDGDLELSAGQGTGRSLQPTEPYLLGTSQHPWGTLTVSSVPYSKPQSDQIAILKNTPGGGFMGGNSMALYPTRLYFYDPGSSYENQYIYGADLIRNGNDTIVASQEKNIYILAGISRNNTDNFHTALISAYSSGANNASNIFSAGNWNVNSGEGELHIGAPRKIETWGPLEINYYPSDYLKRRAYTTTPSYMYDSGIMYSQKSTMLLIAGLELDAHQNLGNRGLLDTILNSINVSSGTSLVDGDNIDYVDSNSKLEIVAGNVILRADNIWNKGNIIPMTNSRNNLGSYDRKFDTLYTDNVIVYDIETDTSTKKFTYRFQDLGSLVYDVDWVSFERFESEDTTPLIYVGDADKLYVRGRFNSVSTRTLSVVNYMTVDSYIQSDSYIQADLGFKERNRTTKLGEWVDINWLTANAAFEKYPQLPTSVVSNIAIVSYSYTLIGKTIILNFVVKIAKENGGTLESYRLGNLNTTTLMGETFDVRGNDTYKYDTMVYAPYTPISVVGSDYGLASTIFLKVEPNYADNNESLVLWLEGEGINDGYSGEYIYNVNYIKEII